MFRTLLCLASLLFSVAAGRDAPIPDEFTSRYSGTIVWIRADKVVDGAGHLVPGVLSDTDTYKLERSASKAHSLRNGPRRAATDARDACDATLGPLVDDVVASATARSLSDIMANARQSGYIRARLTNAATGLYLGTPFIVFRGDVGRHGSAIYVLIPGGSVTIDGTRYCSNDSRFRVPEVGDSIFFTASPPLDVDETLYRPQADNIVYEHAGVLQLPPHVAGNEQTPGLRLDDIEREIGRQYRKH